MKRACYTVGILAVVYLVVLRSHLTMARPVKSALATLTGFGLFLSLASLPAAAQIDGGFDDLSGDADSNEIFSGSGVSLGDLINRTSRGGGMTSGDFSKKTDRNISEAAADFHRRSQEAQATPATPGDEVESQL